MSAVSANATGLPDRRHFLSTVAAVGALSLPTLLASAAKPGPIEIMFAEHLRLEALFDVAASKVMDAEERYEEPEAPSWHPFRDEGGYRIIRTSPGRGYCFLDDSEENIVELKDTIAREDEPDLDDAGCSNKNRARRARETLAKIEVWQAEVRRRKDVAGLIEAEAAEAEAYAAADAQRTAILAAEARTVRELAFQAAVLDIDWDQRAAQHVLERLTVLAGVTPYAS